MDDQSVGRALRLLRQRLGLRQVDVAERAKVSQTIVSRAERGQVAELKVGTVRSLFAVVDAGCPLAPWWRSGAIDRLLDEDHAMLVAQATAYLERRGWTIEVEVSFAIYGERGSIDILATRREDGAVLVVEIKTRLMSIEELLRTLDKKVRLAPKIVEDRLGWRPRIVARIVVFADDTTNRRRVARATVLETALPLRSPELGVWLGRPLRPAAGLLFLPLSPGATGRRRSPARQRIRRPGPRTNRPADTAPRGGVGAYQSPGD
jgi:transcriptional regulator with XRE-family HTH domain